MKRHLNSDGNNIFTVNNDGKFSTASTCDVGNPCPGLGRANKCGGANPVNWIPPLPSWQHFLELKLSNNQE